MMETVFDELFSVVISHNYYDDDKCPDFKINPTQLTNIQLKNRSLLFRKITNGFKILAQVQKTGSSTPLTRLESNQKLSFILQQNNSYFSNFTELPFSSGSYQIFHLSNKNNNLQNSRLLLSASAADKYVSGSDLVNVKSMAFTYKQTSSGTNAIVTVVDIDGSIIMSETAEVSEGAFSCFIDLRSYQPGRYKLYADGILKLDFYADDYVLAQKVFAVADIYLDENVSASYELLDSNGNISAKEYYIYFNSRKIHWKYLVALKHRSNVDPDDLSIDYPDSTNAFTRQTAITLSNGLTAVPFISNIEIPFSENPIKGIKLKKSSVNGGGTFENDNLPNASIRNIKPDITNDKVYSEIFVYI
ncbi:MAG: hypothetical protein JW995_08435 [Melioribacteraceae bacterium]|nr:hypothetical protein [Melioribacteraceae bacterium]